MATNRKLPFDTDRYDDLPVSVFILEPVYGEDGELRDFRVVYANEHYLNDWRMNYADEDHKVLMRERHVLDEKSLGTMERFLKGEETPHAFSMYVPINKMHVHYQPMSGLTPPYVGYFLTDITGNESQEAKMHFLSNISQMKNNSVLLMETADDSLECVFASEEFARMMECGSVEEAMNLMDGQGSIETTVPEDRIFVRRMMRRRVSDEGTNDLTTQKVTAKGNLIWCNIQYSFIDDFDEHYIYCNYFDVTQQKQYEERLRSVYMSMGSEFYRLEDNTLGLLRVNLTRDNIEDAKGTDLFSTDLPGRPFSVAISLRSESLPIAEERAHFIETFDRKRLIEGYAEGRTHDSDVFFSKRKDGNYCYVELSLNLTRHPMTGDIIAFITESKYNNEKVEETLLEHILTNQYDMISYIVNGKYGVVIGDAASIEKGSIFPLSRTGVYKDYLASQVIPVLCDEEDGQRAEAMARALSLEMIEEQTKRRRPYIVNISCLIDGEVYHKRLDYYMVDPKAQFYIVLKSDTTDIYQEQMRRNNQLRDALKEAEAANVAKTAFLSSMSHEIRTPMNAIIGLDNIALKDPDLPDRTREHLEKMGASARHLLSLINDILDMSRIESGRMVLKNEEFRMKGLLDQVNTLADSQCMDKGLQYECVVNGSLDECYIGDDTKLKQVLINILGNAVKFTDKGGKVSLTVERIAKFEDQSTLEFRIKDNGIGMDKEYIPKIFEAFSQEDATTTNKYGGSGLGLAITKNIVELMNGHIVVESEKGVGSEFIVTVSLKNVEGGALAGQNFTMRPQDMHVLIIDDDPVALEHAKLVLEEIGVSSETCLSGKDALEMIRLAHARSQAYNLILVDWKMPEMDGVEVTKHIREIVGNESAIVILTAYNWADIEGEALLAGVDSFMSKPLFATGILQEFEQAIRKKHAKHPEEEELADLTGRKILLAEDMAINAEIMIELLEMMDMKAEHAENGQIAVDMFSEHPEAYYDAVLMDIRMPVMDGLSATAAIRALNRPDAKTVPIIAMTANAFDEDVQRSLQMGMNAHLTKPVEPEKLYDTLARLIKD